MFLLDKNVSYCKPIASQDSCRKNIWL